jgi:formylglycine-generating enzyme required for sulfatase activity
MFGKTTPPAETLPEDRVRLKPFLGIRPGVYLAVLYSLVILIILFFVLFYPGISKPGSLGIFSSEPSGAAVRVGGITMGAAPCEVFIPRGKQVIEMVLPGFTPFRIEKDIPAKLFASAFFPRREYIRGELRTDDPLRVLALGASDYAAWTFAGEPTAAYQIPLSLSDAAYRAGPAAADPAVRDAMEGILRGAARFAVTRAAARDLLRAKMLVDNGGLSPSPVSLVRSAADILSYLSQNPGAAAWIAELLPREERQALTGSAWYAQTAAAPSEAPAGIPAGTAPGGSLELGGLSFAEVPGGVLVREEAFPRTQPVAGFWIAGTVVSAAAWEAFTAARPEWGKDRTGTLAGQGLVTEDYLAPYEHPGYPYPAVPGVSWHAAQAYCRWLSSLLPPGFADYEARLPAEAEWEYAVKNAGGFLENTGDMWEWCGDPFAPLSFLAAPEAPLIDSPERSLRGGSWVNAPNSVTIETRASLPPSSCSPFVSFRPVIARKPAAAP